MKKVLKKILGMVLVCALFLGKIGAEKADAAVVPGEKSMYDVMTPKLTQAAYDYMNEVYVKKYPKLSLRQKYGTPNDQSVIKTLAQKVTKGCKTNQQKVDKIAHWIKENIRYKGGTSPYAIDGFYERKGNCVTDSHLMVDMLRSLQIPAVYVDGYYANMKNVPVYGEIGGHSWCYAYLDGTWKLYDIVYKKYGLSDKKEIEKYYYHERIEGIYMTFSGMNWEKSIKNTTAVVYENGKHYAKTKDTITDAELVGSTTNDVLFWGITKQDNGTYFYPDVPEQIKGMTKGQLFTNGWINNDKGQFIYVYEDGMMANNIFIDYKGKSYFMYYGRSLRMDIPKKYCSVGYGMLCFSKGYKGKSFTFSTLEQYENQKDYTFSYSSDKPNVLAIAQDGTIECKNEGIAKITVKVYQKGNAEPVAEDYTSFGVWKEETPDYSSTADIEKKSAIKSLKNKNVTLNSLKSKKKKTLTVKWKELKEAKGYQVVYATNKKFTKKKKKIQTKNTLLTIKKLKSKKKYYLKVRGYIKWKGKMYYSKWSKGKRIKVQ